MPSEKKAKSRSRKSEGLPTKPRSTASIFANGELEIGGHEVVGDGSNGSTGKTQSRSLDEKSGKQGISSADAELTREEELRMSQFPMCYVYEFQDFLNDNMTLCRFVQLLVFFYLGEVIYVYHNERFWQKYSVIGFNGFGLVVALVMSYRMQLKKYTKKPEIFEKPQLPEFNLIYSVFLPTAISFLIDLRLFLANLSLNYFSVDNMIPVAKVMSVFMFFEVYKAENEVSTLEMVRIIALYVVLQYTLTSLNTGNELTSTKISREVVEEDDNVDVSLMHEENHNFESGRNQTLDQAEIQLICKLIVNLLYGLKELNQYSMPLYILQKLMLSFLEGCVLVYPLMKLRYYKKNMLIDAAIVLTFVGAFVFLTNYQLESVLQLKNAIKWLYDYIFTSETRTLLLGTWVLSLLVIIPIIFKYSSLFSLNSRRKIWHYILIAMISYPALVTEPTFVLIGLFGAIVLFIMIEALRYNKLTMVGEWLFEVLAIFQDFKDLKGPLNLSYIFLIVGVTLPIAFDYCINEELTCKAYIGIIGLGVGDAFASLIGKKYGTIKWKGSSRSVQGTFAFMFSSFACFGILDRYILPGLVKNWESTLVCCVLGGVSEGVSNLNDNFLIPCIMYIALQALENI